MPNHCVLDAGHQAGNLKKVARLMDIELAV
jgi:hypothetical protein